jgi:hypothetical protein
MRLVVDGRTELLNHGSSEHEGVRRVLMYYI